MSRHESVTGGTILKGTGTQDKETPYGVDFSLNAADPFARPIRKVKDGGTMPYIFCLQCCYHPKV